MHRREARRGEQPQRIRTGRLARTLPISAVLCTCVPPQGHQAKSVVTLQPVITKCSRHTGRDDFVKNHNNIVIFLFFVVSCFFFIVVSQCTTAASACLGLSRLEGDERPAALDSPSQGRACKSTPPRARCWQAPTPTCAIPDKTERRARLYSFAAAQRCGLDRSKPSRSRLESWPGRRHGVAPYLMSTTALLSQPLNLWLQWTHVRAAARARIIARYEPVLDRSTVVACMAAAVAQKHPPEGATQSLGLLGSHASLDVDVGGTLNESGTISQVRLTLRQARSGMAVTWLRGKSTSCHGCGARARRATARLEALLLPRLRWGPRQLGRGLDSAQARAKTFGAQIMGSASR